MHTRDERRGAREPDDATPRTRRRYRGIVVLLALAAAGSGAVLLPSHGARVALMTRLALESPALVVEALEFVDYWTATTLQVRFNPRTGVRDLEWIDERREAGDPLEEAKLLWHRGDAGAAIVRLEALHRQRGESESSVFWLAMSHLRLAETTNCLASGHDGPAASCALPFRTHHRRHAPAATAARLFQRLLETYDRDNRLYQWLLNFSYMTLGAYPDQVPRRHLVQTAFTDYFYEPERRRPDRQSEELAFTDRARELGVDTLDAGKGVAVEDFDGDGYLDIVTGGLYSGLAYYLNRSGEGFVERAAEAGLSGVRGVHTITAADFDGDGWMDLLASTPNAGPKGRLALLRNRGDGTFDDVTRSAGLVHGRADERERAMIWQSAWGDVDNDGDLDLFLACFALFNPLGDGPMRRSALYINDDGRFSDRTEAWGLARVVDRQTLFGAAFGDFDADGYLDLAVTHGFGGGKALLRNVGGRRFEETDLIVPTEGGFMVSFLDVDHDGDLDLFLAAAPGLARAITTQVVFGERELPLGHTSIWLQDDGAYSADNGFFRDQMPIGTMGSSFGDLNNDGAYDFYLGTGNPEGWYILPNLMYLGETVGGRPIEKLVNVSRAHGFGSVQKGHGIVFFDFDNDGDEDVYSSLGGMWPGDAWPNQLFVNDSRLDAAWTKIRLRGRESNRFGLGARIKVVARDAEGRPVERFSLMDNRTGFGSAPYLAHVGLGEAIAIERVEVTWPGDLRPLIYRAEIGRLNLLDQADGLPAANPESLAPGGVPARTARVARGAAA